MTRTTSALGSILSGILVCTTFLSGCRSDRHASSQPEVVVNERPTASPFDDGGPPRATPAYDARPAPGSQELIGQRVRVSLRRDALGLAANSTPEPDANMIGGKQVLL